MTTKDNNHKDQCLDYTGEGEDGVKVSIFRVSQYFFFNDAAGVFLKSELTGFVAC